MTRNPTTLLHADMDAFFASVELLKHPEWRGKPVIVGSSPHERGVVSTCSYEARRFGVHSAMPSRTAYELCPQAIFTPPDMARYQEVSAQAFEVFAHYSPAVEGVSIDEAFLDITGTIHLHGSARALGEKLRQEMQATCGVTCSVGIAPNRLLAKIGSERNKPNGLTLMPFEPREIEAFLRDQPLSILWGVGKKTVELLRRFNLHTCGDIQRLDPAALAAIIGEAAAESVREHAFGRSSAEVYWQEADEKSVSREHTFDRDTGDREVIRAKLLELVSEVGYRFRRKERWACTAKLKLRDAAFNTITRQIALETPSRDDIAFRQAALDLLKRESFARLRLIGFGVTNIRKTPDGETPLLFETEDSAKRRKRENLARTIDSLRDRGLL